MNLYCRLLILLLFVPSVFSSETDCNEKLKVALGLVTVKSSAQMLHVNLDSIFDKYLAESSLINADPALVKEFREEYESAVDNYLSEESIALVIATHISTYFTLEQLQNSALFYDTTLGKKVKDVLLNGKTLMDELSKEELTQLLGLYKKYGILELMKVKPQVMALLRKDLTRKVNLLRSHYYQLEEKYLAMHNE